MAARSLRHLIGDATLAGVQTRPLAHIGHRAIAAQGGQGLPPPSTPPAGGPPPVAFCVSARPFPRHVSAMFPPCPRHMAHALGLGVSARRSSGNYPPVSNPSTP